MMRAGKGMFLAVTMVSSFAFPGWAPEEEDPDKLQHPVAPEIAKARELVERADALATDRRFEPAIQAYRDALELMEIHGGESKETASTTSKLGQALRGGGRTQEACAVLERALALRRQSWGEGHPEVGTGLSDLAGAYDALGRHAEALRLREECLAIFRRVHKGDHSDVSASLNNMANTLTGLGRHLDSLKLRQECIAMNRRLYATDDPRLATSVWNLASNYAVVGRQAEALPLFEEAVALHRGASSTDDRHFLTCLRSLAYWYQYFGRRQDELRIRQDVIEVYQRVHEADHPEVVVALSFLAGAHDAIGQHREALARGRESLEMSRRLFDGDHPSFAHALSGVAETLCALGRAGDALPLQKEALDMRRRIHGGDHHNLAASISDLAATYTDLGRPSDALPFAMEALAMYRRLYPGDSPQVATCLSNVGHTYDALGRPAAALPFGEQALAMRRRLFDSDHPELAHSLDNLAGIYSDLGRPAAALPLREEALAMFRRIFRGDHADVAISLGNLANTCTLLGRAADSITLRKEALAMQRRLYEGDHPAVATTLGSLGVTLRALDRPAEALPLLEEALEMRRRLFGGDHFAVAQILQGLGPVLDALGRRPDAIRTLHECVEMARSTGWSNRHSPLAALAWIHFDQGDAASAAPLLDEAIRHLESLRRRVRTLGTEQRANYLASLRAGTDPFALMVRVQLALDRPEEAIRSIERGRAREMLDLLHRSQIDPLERARERATALEDRDASKRIEEVSLEVEMAQRIILDRARAAARARATGDREKSKKLQSEEFEARRELLKSLERRHRIVSEVLPEASPLAPESIQELLEPGERMLVYSIQGAGSFAMLVGPTGERIGSYALPQSLERPLHELVGAYADALAKVGQTADSVRMGQRLFDLLVPSKLWEEVKGIQRLYVVPHGSLHTLPFEALVTGISDGKPLYWLDDGPPIVYESSGSVLSWLRSRPSAGPGASIPITALGDPDFGSNPVDVPWPDSGALIRGVAPGTQASEIDLRPGDVVIAYGSNTVSDLPSLGAAMRAVDPTAASVKLRFVRDGEERTVNARPGRLGISVAREPPPVSGPKLFGPGSSDDVQRSAHARRGRLTRLPGTRSEVNRIRAAFLKADPNTEPRTLLGSDATEARLREAAKGARFLHLATHGIIDETETASFSALALTMPQRPVPGNDGLLTLVDLFERWRGRLEGTELVVLSACESQRGRLDRDEGMFALPWGFCFAGSRAAVASLWKVDDKSTADLMADFYMRMLAKDGADKCRALHEAKNALKAKYPDPYHWAPFVFVGAP